MEVAVRVLHIITERLQILERLLNPFLNREVHVLLGLEKISIFSRATSTFRKLFSSFLFLS